MLITIILLSKKYARFQIIEMNTKNSSQSEISTDKETESIKSKEN